MTKSKKATPKYKVRANSLSSQSNFLDTSPLNNAPKVYYSNMAWNKLNKVINMCTEEVGWMGTVNKVGKNYLITDIFVPKQTVTGSETDISAESLAKLVHDLDYPENLYYWGHSHVNMGVSPSGQDEDQTSEYLEHNDVFIRGIYNKKGDSKVDVFDVKGGVQHQSVENGLETTPLPKAVMKKFTEGVTKNVKKHLPSQNNMYNDSPFRDYGRHKPVVRANYQNPFIIKEG